MSEAFRGENFPPGSSHEASTSSRSFETSTQDSLLDESENTLEADQSGEQALGVRSQARNQYAMGGMAGRPTVSQIGEPACSRQLAGQDSSTDPDQVDSEVVPQHTALSGHARPLDFTEHPLDGPQSVPDEHQTKTNSLHSTQNTHSLTNGAKTAPQPINLPEKATILLTLLCFLCGNEIPESMLVRIREPQKEWTASGELGVVSAAELGLDKDVILILSDEDSFQNAIKTLISSQHIKSRGCNPNRTFMVDVPLQLNVQQNVDKDRWRRNALVFAFVTFPLHRDQEER